MGDLSEGEPAPVSVIIAARNEEENLQKYLPLVLAQKGVPFEVIVADDCSVDDTQLVLRKLEEQYSNLRHTRLQENGTFQGGKKYALTLAIKAAKYEHLVFIDADCAPAGDNWLVRMAHTLEQRPIALGYSPFFKRSGLLNRIVRMDAFLIGMQYLSFALARVPYMGVGRNMGYRSFLFFEAKGFSSHYDIRSGDDDLFVNQVAQGDNVAVVLDRQAFTYSEAKATPASWFRQKRRHLTTAIKYRRRHLILFGLLTGSQYILFGLFVAFLIMQWQMQVVIAVFGVRYIVQQVIILLGLRRTGELDLWPVALIFEPIYLAFYPALVLANIIERSNEWKR